ncbi:MAG TPA: hypothetical protein PLQ12_05590, partial [Candidatus Defluviicoccus seviourii]|nr:hypothetical protein [Candidatus Defluviicoccus seviourii]
MSDRFAEASISELSTVPRLGDKLHRLCGQCRDRLMVGPDLSGCPVAAAGAIGSQKGLLPTAVIRQRPSVPRC